MFPRKNIDKNLFVMHLLMDWLRIIFDSGFWKIQKLPWIVPAQRLFLHMALEHFAVYYLETRVTATVSPKDEPTATKQALMTTTRRQCFLCGRAYHERKYCPAINSTCFSCGRLDTSPVFVGQITALEKG